MKQRTTQFGVRKNPDSLRVHGLRLTADSSWLRSGNQTANTFQSKLSSEAERLALPCAGDYDV